MRILIVEDHHDTWSVYERALLRAGHEVTHASTAATAKALCASLSFDLLVCDLSLPDQTGWELLTEIRQSCNTPAIAVSGLAAANDIEHSREAGFMKHLNKPLDLKELLRVVDEIGQHRSPPAGESVDGSAQSFA